MPGPRFNMFRLTRARAFRGHLLQRPRIQRRALAQLRHPPAVRYQTVRFQRPAIFSFRRIGTLALYVGVAVGYWSLILHYLDIEIEIVDGEEEETTEAQDEEASDSEDDEGPYYADDESLFIPLTWAMKMPRAWYRGSDPEWQEFLKIARDKQRHTKIQDELVQLVYSGAVQHPQIQRMIGKDATVGKYWLDVSFPEGPPQDYQRSGIEIGDGFVAWSQQRVTPEDQWRVARALWPSAAAGGVWAATTTLVGIQYRRLKQALGYEAKDPTSPEERYRTMLDILKKQQPQKNDKATSETSSNSATMAGAPSSSAQSDTQKKLPWHISVPLPNATGADGNVPADVPIAMHVFSRSLQKSWNPKKMEPPRGSFVVQGLVEVRGARGRMLFDVQSAYDPKQGKYVQVSVGVRIFKRWNQAPRGGP